MINCLASFVLATIFFEFLISFSYAAHPGKTVTQGSQSLRPGPTVKKGASSRPGPTNFQNYKQATANGDGPVSFSPVSLDFGEKPLCVPAKEEIVISNTNDKAELVVSSVYADSGLHFHPSLEKEPVASPGGTTSINVIFLPRAIGKAEGTLFIQTSAGNYMYNLVGWGADNRYKLRPILGHKLPVDVNFRRAIMIYNPHEYVLRLKEVYTSEGFLLLSLPDAPQDHSKLQVKLWEIPPKQSKSVILLNFKAEKAGKYQGFVHIKTHQDNLIMHVEFVVSKSGVHRVEEQLDFGTIISATETRTRDIVLMNSSPSAVEIKLVYVEAPDSSLEIAFAPMTLAEGVMAPVATVKYTGGVQGAFSGKLVLRTSDTSPLSSRIEMPYKVRVIHGTIDYNKQNTSFYVREEATTALPATETKQLHLLNSFRTAIEFKTVEMSDENFHVGQFDTGTVIPPQHVLHLLTITFQPNNTDLFYTTHLVLHTNITRLYIPLQCYHGRLAYTMLTVTGGEQRRASDEDDSVTHQLVSGVSSSSATDNTTIDEPSTGRRLTAAASLLSNDLQSVITEGGLITSQHDLQVVGRHAVLSNKLEFGLVGLNESKFLNFSLTNPNPLPITVVNWKTDLRNIKARYIGLGTDVVNGSQQLILKTGQSQIFIAELTTTEEEERWGYIQFNTTTKPVHIDVHYIAMEGQLKFEPSLQFGGSFQGRTVKRPLVVRNSYRRPLQLTSITSSDPRFVPFLTKAIINRGQKTEVGYVLFDPSKRPTGGRSAQEAAQGTVDHFPEDSGTPKDHSKTDMWNPNLGNKLTPEELNVYIERNEVFKQMNSSVGTEVHAVLTFNTDVEKTYSMPLQGSLIQPNIIEEPIMNFGLSQVGTTKSLYVKIHNPANSPVQVNIYSLQQLGFSSNLLKAFGFSKQVIRDIERQQHDAVYSLPEDGTLSSVIAAGEKAVLGPIHYSPTSLNVSRSIFYLKNNLTLIDIVEVHGEGGQGRLTWLDHKGVEVDKLHLRVLESQLKQWIEYSPNPFLSMPELLQVAINNPWADSAYPEDNAAVIRAGGARPVASPEEFRDFEIGKNGFPMITFARNFTAVNNGNLPVEVTHTTMKGIKCSLYGVYIDKCNGFTLNPTERTSVELSFSPDFSTSYVKLALYAHTVSQGTLSYPVEIELPHALLSPLYDSTPRSFGENVSRCILLALCLLMGVYVLNVWHKEFWCFTMDTFLQVDNGNNKAFRTTKQNEKDICSTDVDQQQQVDKRGSGDRGRSSSVGSLGSLKSNDSLLPNSVAHSTESHNMLLDDRSSSPSPSNGSEASSRGGGGGDPASHSRTPSTPSSLPAKEKNAQKEKKNKKKEKEVEVTQAAKNKKQQKDKGNKKGKGENKVEDSPVTSEEPKKDEAESSAVEEQEAKRDKERDAKLEQQRRKEQREKEIKLEKEREREKREQLQREREIEREKERERLREKERQEKEKEEKEKEKERRQKEKIAQKEREEKEREQQQQQATTAATTAPASPNDAVKQKEQDKKVKPEKEITKDKSDLKEAPSKDKKVNNDKTEEDEPIKKEELRTTPRDKIKDKEDKDGEKVVNNNNTKHQKEKDDKEKKERETNKDKDVAVSHGKPVANQQKNNKQQDATNTFKRDKPKSDDDTVAVGGKRRPTTPPHPTHAVSRLVGESERSERNTKIQSSTNNNSFVESKDNHTTKHKRYAEKDSLMDRTNEVLPAYPMESEIATNPTLNIVTNPTPPTIQTNPQPAFKICGGASGVNISSMMASFNANNIIAEKDTILGGGGGGPTTQGRRSPPNNMGNHGGRGGNGGNNNNHSQQTGSNGKPTPTPYRPSLGATERGTAPGPIPSGTPPSSATPNSRSASTSNGSSTGATTPTTDIFSSTGSGPSTPSSFGFGGAATPHSNPTNGAARSTDIFSNAFRASPAASVWGDDDSTGRGRNKTGNTSMSSLFGPGSSLFAPQQQNQQQQQNQGSPLPTTNSPFSFGFNFNPEMDGLLFGTPMPPGKTADTADLLRNISSTT